ncbi:helix-turn-helix domain-containing protein [Pseudomonas frederiksbergensis]|uniref:helix-turn-helix domain-containing protein n=1 Tax=Pseudomonas frederiksbergensis TaxID=104087 RepID=UPI003D08BA04
MDSESLVQLALNALSCSQKELAIRVGVSPTQISKWKKGEHLSRDMEEKLRAIANIGDRDPSFVLLAGSLEGAKKWEKLIHILAKAAQDGAETGYNTYLLSDEDGFLCSSTFDVLQELGVIFPKVFPIELDIDYESSDDEDLWDLIGANPLLNLIYQIYQSLNDVYGFYAAYVSELLTDDELGLFDTPASEIEYSLMSLAACKIEENQELTPKITDFKRRTIKDFEDWISIIKDKAFRAGVPLRAELLNMVYRSGGELGHEAEAESLGINQSRIHPDIYMNELLEGMRIIHQVLPVIMKKLGIDNEFELDTSDLRIR